MRYYIKYGNHLYFGIDYLRYLTPEMFYAHRYPTLALAERDLEILKREWNLYELRIVPESDISLVVENVP